MMQTPGLLAAPPRASTRVHPDGPGGLPPRSATGPEDELDPPYPASGWDDERDSLLQELLDDGDDWARADEDGWFYQD